MANWGCFFPGLWPRNKVFDNHLAIDLILKMLHFNPHKRPSAEELLKHPFLYPLNPPKKEMVKPCVIPYQEFMFEAMHLNTEQLKDIAYEEILWHHFEEYKKIWGQRNQMEENPYLEFLENENKEFDDGEEEEFEGSEDSFRLGD